MKLTDVVKELVKEGKLSDFGDNNTPAALKKEKEIGGPSGPEPTRYGDWEKKGICYDF